MEPRPEHFTYPFRYVPHPSISEAAGELIRRIDGDPTLRGLFSEGKMLGVLMTDSGFLYAFSGLAGGRSTVEGFVPPIFDLTDPQGHFRTREAAISSMPAGEGRRQASAQLQDWIFRQYVVLNARGESMSVKDIFARRGLVPPAGTGDCAGPKLLQYAYLHGMKPLAMGEFWYGESHSCEVREQGRFYPSCTGKCGPLLSYMLEGLDVEPDPLDRDYDGQSPEIIYADEHIIVADKPSGMLSVPGRTRSKSLLEWLLDRFPEVHSCHRLDMDTSGLIVFARNVAAKAAMEKQFAQREVVKTYRARLSSGSSPFRHASKGTIALPLASDYYDRPRQTVDFSCGKQAITEYEITGRLPNGEIEVIFRPHTGRTHQLRVHAAHPLGLGRPVKGDRLYGSADTGKLYLRAVSISFRHPASGKEMFFDISDTRT